MKYNVAVFASFVHGVAASYVALTDLYVEKVELWIPASGKAPYRIISL
jgi:hypothetical protein